jgi:hypothetical protein
MGKRARQFQHRVARHRRHHRARTQSARAQDAQNVAAHPFARMVGQQGTVAVAIGRNDRIEPIFRRPFTGQNNVFGADGFGIDRDEFGRTANRHALGAQRLDNGQDDIAPNGRMLINANGAPGQASSPNAAT